MKNTIHLLLALIICVLIKPSAFSQAGGDFDKASSMVTVHLKNGSVVEGKIIEWAYGDFINLEMPWGSELKLEDQHIKKIIQHGIQVKDIKPYNFANRQLYFTARAQAILPNDGNRGHGVFGFGLSASAGYRFNRLLSIGGGFGFDRYLWDSGEDIVSIFSELSGYFNPTNTSLFYNLQMGYGFASPNNRYLLSEAKGGILTYPSIGIRFGSDNVKKTFDIGYKFQNAEFTYRDPWTSDRRSEQDVLFKRLTVRFGVIW